MELLKWIECGLVTSCNDCKHKCIEVKEAVEERTKKSLTNKSDISNSQALTNLK